MAAFPKMPDPTINLLKERFKANGFSDDRLKDAVANVIDNYEGWDKSPNIANFINFDKKVKIYNYKESLEYGQKYLVAVDLGFNEPRWITKEDQHNFKIKLWSKNENNGNEKLHGA